MIAIIIVSAAVVISGLLILRGIFKTKYKMTFVGSS